MTRPQKALDELTSTMHIDPNQYSPVTTPNRLKSLGYALAVTAQIIVFPWFGLHPSLGENMALGAVFVGISLVRSYELRRLFEAVGKR